MKHGYWFIGIFALLGSGLLSTCQNVPSEPVTKDVQLLSASQKTIGLARNSDNGILLHGRQVNAHNGGRVGGDQTGGSYIEIPPNTLKEDMPITFAIYVTSDGILIFDISQCQQNDFDIQLHSDHIEFQEGQTATLAISKDLVSGSPNAVVNYDDLDEQYTQIKDGGDYWVWIIDLPHFSRYG